MELFLLCDFVRKEGLRKSAAQIRTGHEDGPGVREKLLRLERVTVRIRHERLNLTRWRVDLKSFSQFGAKNNNRSVLITSNLLIYDFKCVCFCRKLNQMNPKSFRVLRVLLCENRIVYCTDRIRRFPREKTWPGRAGLHRETHSRQCADLGKTSNTPSGN